MIASMDTAEIHAKLPVQGTGLATLTARAKKQQQSALAKLGMSGPTPGVSISVIVLTLTLGCATKIQRAHVREIAPELGVLIV